MIPIDWLYTREEKREDEAEDSGINDEDHVTSLGNYAEAGSDDDTKKCETRFIGKMTK